MRGKSCGVALCGFGANSSLRAFVVNRRFDLCACLRSQAEYRSQPKPHYWRRVSRTPGLQRVMPRTACDIHWPHLHAVPLRIFNECSRRIEPHRLCIEHRAKKLWRVVMPQIRTRIHDQREARGVTLGEAIVRKGIDLIVDPLRNIGRNAIRFHSRDHPLADVGHPLAAALVPHRAA